MKAILISIKPKWVAKILNGEKSIEIRKTMPKCELPIDVYVYCTKEKNTFLGRNHNGFELVKGDYNHFKPTPDKWAVNGKVVAKFTLKKVEPIVKSYHNYWGGLYYSQDLTEINLLDKAQISREEIGKYLENSKGYAWYIDNLVIFDKPKKIRNFMAYGKFDKVKYDCPKAQRGRCNYHWLGSKDYHHCIKAELTKAPQSYCFVEV